MRSGHLQPGYLLSASFRFGCSRLSQFLLAPVLHLTKREPEAMSGAKCLRNNRALRHKTLSSIQSIATVQENFLSISHFLMLVLQHDSPWDASSKEAEWVRWTMTSTRVKAFCSLLTPTWSRQVCFLSFNIPGQKIWAVSDQVVGAHRWHTGKLLVPLPPPCPPTNSKKPSASPENAINSEFKAASCSLKDAPEDPNCFIFMHVSYN